MKKLNEAKISKEMLEKIEACATPEELVKLAKDNGVELSLEEAKQVLDALDRDLTDEELEKVAGGYCWDDCNYSYCPADYRPGDYHR